MKKRYFAGKKEQIILFDECIISLIYLHRYAFILYDNEQEAANVIKQADQYKINGRPLMISFYRNRRELIQQ